MFLRIYSGIAIAILLALATVYTVYQVSYDTRYTNYSQGVIKGSLILISQGYQRQAQENRQRWTTLISQLTGFKLKFTELPSSASDQWTQYSSSDYLNFRSVKSGLQIDLQLNQISEQQFRAIALLALNELAVNTEQDVNATLSRIAQLYPFTLDIVSPSEIKLDNQQRRRLNSGNVVAVSDTDSKQTSIYVKAPNNQILLVGPIDSFDPLTTQTLVLLVLISIIITSSVTYGLIRRLERRLNVVNNILAEFGPQKLTSRVPISGKDVITQLGVKVNEMADRIEELLAHQKEITQAVSHELRTPIARIKFRIQMLNDAREVSGEILTQQELEARTSAINKDIQQLEALIDEMLTLHKLDKNPNEYQRLPIDIAPILDNIIESNSIRFDHINIDNQISNSINVQANAQDINRLLENLITNACKHAKSKIILCCQLNAPNYNISVEDDGEGVPENQRERIFQPFTRLENLQNKKNTGYGLGLAIVQRIAKLNEVEVRVEDSQLGGAKFQLSFANHQLESPEVQR